MLSALPQIKILGGKHGLTVSEFSRRMIAEWRRGSWPELDRIDMIFDLVSPGLRRELNLHDECSNSEKNVRCTR